MAKQSELKNMRKKERKKFIFTISNLITAPASLNKSCRICKPLVLLYTYPSHMYKHTSCSLPDLISNGRWIVDLSLCFIWAQIPQHAVVLVLVCVCYVYAVICWHQKKNSIVYIHCSTQKATAIFSVVIHIVCLCMTPFLENAESLFTHKKADKRHRS